MNLKTILHDCHDEFVLLCRSHKVSKIYAFGSVLTKNFDPKKSDIDVIVSLDITDPLDYGEMLLTFWNNLETFFNRKVDLLTEESIRNPYLRKNIDSSKKLIYDGQREEIFV